MTHLSTNPPADDRILRALREARSQLEAMQQARQEQVAIVGMAGRFPGAESVEALWQLLKAGESGIRFLSDTELEQAGVSPDTFQQPDYVRAHSGLTDAAGFDAAFFGYSPREAELLDPQHRVFLECAWAALEDAGYDSRQYPGRIGVYGGAALNSYLVNLFSDPKLRESVDSVQAVISNVMGLMTTRVSYQLDLKGPSCGIQTGCSTSLVSVHQACQSLLHQECDMALVGGVTVGNTTPQGYRYDEGGIASPDGCCRAFDAASQGTVFGSGVGIVVLKRLSEAQVEGDTIYAVIKGSAVNNDGADKVSLTAPSVSGQTAVIAAALEDAGVDAASISYVEAHGTGTALGDPIEVAALTKAFSEHPGPCALGSVKTNLGHLDAAAGVAGLIKTALALKHQQLPPSLHFQQPNPQIDFASGPFTVQQQLSDWPRNGTPRRAGVSSFGMGGTNAHVILEEAPPIELTQSNAQPAHQLLVLSAKTAAALDQATANLAAYLQAHPNLNLADVAHTLQVGRRPFTHRRICRCQSLADAAQQLTSGTLPTQVAGDAPRTLAFMFSGQGSQHPNMGRDLYDREPVFRQAIARCAEILAEEGMDLLAVLYPEAIAEPDSAQINQTAIAQPALFAVEYALAQLWQSWGIEPDALIGHSIGEYVAACVAGVFSLEDGLRLVAARGRLMQACPPGAMLSVMQPEQELLPLLPTEVTVAAVNGPSLCAVSGTTEAIAAFQADLDSKGISCRRLHTSHGFHSLLMEPAVAELEALVSQITLQPPQIDLLSNVTGTWLTAAEATDPSYWARHLRQPVQLYSGVRALLDLPNPVLLEVGPGRTLKTLAQQALPEPGAALVLNSLPHPKEQAAGGATMLEALGHLWLAGLPVQWPGYHAHEPRRRVPLPTYPFERQRYWVPLRETSERVYEAPQETKAADMADWFYLPTWTRSHLSHLQPPTSELWVVFEADAAGAGLTQRLIDAGQRVVRVHAGAEFAQQGQVYTLNPTRPEDYRTLVQFLAHQGETHWVHGWSAEHLPSAVADSLAGQSADLATGFYSLLYLAQALANTSTPHRLTAIATHTQSVLGTDTVNPEKAALTGLCKVIPQEYSHICCRCLDISLEVNEAAFEQQFGSLYRELGATDPIVAYRDGYRWTQTYQAMPLPEGEPPLKQNGVYLIAGDLVEGLGMTYAQALRQAVQARLVLIGRPGLPPPNEWEQWTATHGPQHEVSRLIRKLQGLGTVGTDYLWFSADLTNAAQTQAIVQGGLTTFGPYHGVIHAGTTGDRASVLLPELAPQDCEAVFRRTREVQTLLSALPDAPEFFLLQSSLSSVVGGVGFGAYAAASSYLDSLAISHSTSHGISQGDAHPRWLSINWDACTDDVPQMTGSKLLDLAMTPEEVWRATRRALAQPQLAQVAVSPTNLRDRFEQWILPPETVAPAAETTTGHTRPQLSSEYVAPRDELEATIATAMQDLLGVEKVGVHDNFFELGGHSLLAIQAVTRLRKEFQVEIPMRAFLFEAPTVAGIAKTVRENQMNDSDQATIETLLDEIESMPAKDIEGQLGSPL